MNENMSYTPKYDRPIPILLLTDFYKICHRMFYNPKTNLLVLYWTPRRSRIDGVDYAVHFGLQYFIKKYLIDRFNSTFFCRPWEEIKEEYVSYLSQNFVREVAEEEIEAFREIYDLGYLPIQIKSVPEGTRVPIGCPAVEIRATEEFAYWVAEYLESIYSCSVWPGTTDATIADHNRNQLDFWYNKTVDDRVPRELGAGNFSMRGMAGEDAVYLADAGHLLSFTSSATVGTGYWLKNYYNAGPEVSRGLPSTEHSVMESYGPEKEKMAYRHIAHDVLPNGGLSLVCDTWNAWRVLDEYIPELKSMFERRNGKVVLRPDSGDPVSIICGSCTLPYISERELDEFGTTEEKLKEYFRARGKKDQNSSYGTLEYEMQTDSFLVSASVWFDQEGEDDEGEPIFSYDPYEVHLELKAKTTEEKGFVTRLWELCGGTINSKGYRVLSPYIGVIYGDAINNQRMNEIFKRLENHDFAANNVILGFGSFTYQYMTRDSLGFALKATHGIINGKETFLYKDPITDRGSHSAGKKSQKGMCIVTVSEDGSIHYTDHHTIKESDTEENLLQVVFRNGKLLVDDDFASIRARLHP